MTAKPTQSDAAESAEVKLPALPLEWAFDGERARAKPGGGWCKYSDLVAMRDFANAQMCSKAASLQREQALQAALDGWEQTIGVAGLVRGDTRHTWRNRRAERAEAELAALKLRLAEARPLIGLAAAALPGTVLHKRLDDWAHAYDGPAPSDVKAAENSN